MSFTDTTLDVWSKLNFRMVVIDLSWKWTPKSDPGQDLIQPEFTPAPTLWQCFSLEKEGFTVLVKHKKKMVKRTFHPSDDFPDFYSKL